jgi:hypothetical protein
MCIYFNLTRAGLDPGPRQTLLLVACLSIAVAAAEYLRLRRTTEGAAGAWRIGFPYAALALLAAAGLAFTWARAYVPARTAAAGSAPLRSDHPIHRSSC